MYVKAAALSAAGRRDRSSGRAGVGRFIEVSARPTRAGVAKVVRQWRQVCVTRATESFVSLNSGPQSLITLM